MREDMKHWTDQEEIQGGDKLEPYVVVEIGDAVRAFGGIRMPACYSAGPVSLRIRTRRKPRIRTCPAQATEGVRQAALSL
jgi:hypothetical protein